MHTFHAQTVNQHRVSHKSRAIAVLIVSIFCFLVSTGSSQAQDSFPLSRFNPWVSGDSD